MHEFCKMFAYINMHLSVSGERTCSLIVTSLQEQTKMLM